MTRDDIIKLAREAGITQAVSRDPNIGTFALLERFAALVAAAVKQVDDDTIEYIKHMDAHIDTAVREAVAAEREACAALCDSRDLGHCNREDAEARRCAKAIRARGQV